MSEEEIATIIANEELNNSRKNKEIKASIKKVLEVRRKKDDENFMRMVGNLYRNGIYYYSRYHENLIWRTIQNEKNRCCLSRD